MRYISIFIILLSLMSLASGYDAAHQAVYDGVRMSYQIGAAYEKYLLTGDATGYNALVDPWNAWVYKNFGQDDQMLMQKLTGPVDLQKPYIAANNTTQGGIVHSVDGSNKAGGPKYTTNDMNLLPESMTQKMYEDLQRAEPGSAAAMAAQGDFLGGI